MGTSKNLQPQLAGRKTVFENRRILNVFEDRRKQFDAPDNEDLRFLEVSTYLYRKVRPSPNKNKWHDMCITIHILNDATTKQDILAVTMPLSQVPKSPLVPAGYAGQSPKPPQNNFAAQLGDGAQPNTPSATTEHDTDFDFFDFLDILNPLQHIPVVSTFYRELTGDELHPASRIVGGTLYGAIPGAVSAVLNTVTEGLTGKDIGEHIADAFFGEDDSPKTAQKAPPQPPNTPPTPDTDQITANDPTAGVVKTGNAALAALYQDLRQTGTPATAPQKPTAPTPTADTTLAAFTRPGEQPPPQNGAFFVENDRKWFHLKQAGGQQFAKSVRVQPPSFSPRRALVDDPITQSIEQSRATENSLMSPVQNYQTPPPPAELAAQMLRNLDRYEALKADKPTQSTQRNKP